MILQEGKGSELTKVRHTRESIFLKRRLKEMKRKIQKIPANKSYQVNLNVIDYIPVYISNFFMYNKLTSMIQIRQKKQNFRQQRRKQFLENHFRELRKRYFNFGVSNSQNSVNHRTQIEEKLIFLLNQSLKVNEMRVKIREANFLFELNELIDQAISKGSLYQYRYLLATIANMFKDDINPFETEDLFRISAKLFQSLNISQVNFTDNNDLKRFKHTLQYVTIDTLTFYISTVTGISQNLEEQDQINIQKLFYPAFSNIVFYSLNNPQIVDIVQDFNYDFKNFISNMFNIHEQMYETGNLQKAKRNSAFFIDIVLNHYFYLRQHQTFIQKFNEVERNLLFLYDKLTQYFEHIEFLFEKKEFFQIIEQTFIQQIYNKKPRNLNRLYSILRTFVDKDMYIQQISFLMMQKKQNPQFQGFIIGRTLRSIQNNQEESQQAFQFIEGLLISFDQKKNFQWVVNEFGLTLVDICANILQNIEKQYLSVYQNRVIIHTDLTILYILFKQGEKEIVKKQNHFLIRFESRKGMKKLEQIADWFNQIDMGDDYQLAKINQLIEYLLTFIQFSVDQQLRQ